MIINTCVRHSIWAKGVRCQFKHLVYTPVFRWKVICKINLYNNYSHVIKKGKLWLLSMQTNVTWCWQRSLHVNLYFLWNSWIVYIFFHLSPQSTCWDRCQNAIPNLFISCANTHIRLSTAVQHHGVHIRFVGISASVFFTHINNILFSLHTYIFFCFSSPMTIHRGMRSCWFDQWLTKPCWGFKGIQKHLFDKRKKCMVLGNIHIYRYFIFMRPKPTSYNIHRDKHLGHCILIGQLYRKGQQMLHSINAFRKVIFASSGDPY